MTDLEALRATSSSPFTPISVGSLDSASSQETGFISLIKYVPNSMLWGGDMEQLLVDFCEFQLPLVRSFANVAKTSMASVQVEA